MDVRNRKVPTLTSAWRVPQQHGSLYGSVIASSSAILSRIFTTSPHFLHVPPHKPYETCWIASGMALLWGPVWDWVLWACISVLVAPIRAIWLLIVSVVASIINSCERLDTVGQSLSWMRRMLGWSFSSLQHTKAWHEHKTKSRSWILWL